MKKCDLALATGPIYDQLPGEPDLWFQRFRKYRNTPPGERSAKAIAGDAGKKSARGSWTKMIAEWRWVERAQAWDTEQTKAAADNLEKAMEQFRTSTVSSLAAAAKLVEECITEQDETKAIQKLRLAGPKVALLLGKGRAGDFLVNGFKALYGERHRIEEYKIHKLEFTLDAK